MMMMTSVSHVMRTHAFHKHRLLVSWRNESIRTNTFTSKVRLVREYYEKREENNNFLRIAADVTDRTWFFQGNLEKVFYSLQVATRHDLPREDSSPDS